MDEIDELNELLDKADEYHSESPGDSPSLPDTSDDFVLRRMHNSSVLKDQKEDFGTLSQWTSPNGQRFTASGKSAKILPPGAYLPHMDTQGNIWFEAVELRTEGLLRFPETNIEMVVEEIEKFWERQDRFAKYDIAFKRGILLYGPPGCHAKGTQILMADGSLKNVEAVRVGDRLMGPDSKPRMVLDLARGREVMFRVTPRKGESFIVNRSHILSLRRSGERDKALPQILNVSVGDYLSMSQPSRDRFKLRHVGVEFPENFDPLPIDPYFLGVWLGDGSSHAPHITTADSEIRDVVYQIAASYDLHVTPQHKRNNLATTYCLAGEGTIGSNSLTSALRALGILNNKHIPEMYLTASRKDRLALLAGLVDTDGGYTTAPWRPSQKYMKTGYKGYFEIAQKRELLSSQIAFLARSLGLGVTVRQKIVNDKSYQRISIYGEISQVPTILPRKQALAGIANKDPLRTGIALIEPIGEDDFYGFSLSGDHLYLTGDFVVHHNSGKSSAIQLVMRDVILRKGVVLEFCYPPLFTEAMRQFRVIQPETPIVVLMEDLDSILERYNHSDVLNLLDGAQRVHKTVFVASTNYPERLGARIVNRPSRFDKRFKIGHPNDESRKLYLEFLCRNHVPKIVNVSQWVHDTHGFSLAHLKELFTSVVLMDNDYTDALRILRSMEEKPSSVYDEDEVSSNHGLYV